MTRRAAEFLKQMPHVGPHVELVNAVRALGLLCIQETQGRASVLFADARIAVIEGDKLSLITEAIAPVAELMPSITPEQGREFNRVLSRLERDKIAVHEAGHVVAAHTFGFKVCFARLGEESQEVQVCDDLDSHGDADTARTIQDYFAAGAAAELIGFGKYRPHGAACDKREVNDIEEELVQLGESTAPEPIDVFDACVQRVQARLSSLKPHIVAIASALKPKGFLTRDEIVSILEKTIQTQVELCVQGDKQP